MWVLFAVPEDRIEHKKLRYKIGNNSVKNASMSSENYSQLSPTISQYAATSKSVILRKFVSFFYKYSIYLDVHICMRFAHIVLAYQYPFHVAASAGAKKF